VKAGASQANRGVMPGGGRGRVREREGSERGRPMGVPAGEWAPPGSEGRSEGVNGRWALAAV
jgi:hypothetical protein